MLNLLIHDLYIEILRFLDDGPISIYNLSMVSKRYYLLVRDRLEEYRKDQQLYVEETIYYLTKINDELDIVEINGPSYMNVLDLLSTIIAIDPSRYERIKELADIRFPLTKSSSGFYRLKDRYIFTLSSKIIQTASGSYKEFNICFSLLGAFQTDRIPISVTYCNLISDRPDYSIDTSLIKKLLRLCYLRNYRIISHYPAPLTFKHVSIA